MIDDVATLNRIHHLAKSTAYNSALFFSVLGFFVYVNALSKTIAGPGSSFIKRSTDSHYARKV